MATVAFSSLRPIRGRAGGRCECCFVKSEINSRTHGTAHSTPLLRRDRGYPTRPRPPIRSPFTRHSIRSHPTGLVLT